MSETQTTRLMSLKDICRCCHSGGNFYSLKEPYKYRGKVEVYYRMLIETFGILICPPTIEVSYTICDDCINRLRDSTIFRNQIEACEEKFNQYNQLFFKPVVQNDDCVETMAEIKKEQNSFEIVNDTVNKDDNVELKIENVTVTSVEDGLGNDDEAQDVEDNELDNIEYELRNIDVTEDIYDEENLKIKIEDKDDDVNNAENALDKTKLQVNCTISNKYVPKSEYNSHLKKHVEESECINCETFDSKERKTFLKHRQKKYTCDICGQQFLRKDGIKSHMSIHMVVKNNTKCNSFLGAGSMKAYSYTEDKNSVQKDILSNYLECRFCKKQVREHYYERHLKVHVKKTECINCGEIFDSIDLVKEHSKKHKLENMYTCDFCKKRFIVKSTLKRHIDLHHMGKGRKFMCHECGVFCNDITNLRAHTTAVHLKLRMFECSVCQKKLASKKTLKIHMRTHTGERPYVCDECDEGFVCFTNLKIHKMKHDIMKKFGTKYVCEICHTTFHGQRLLTHHVRSEHPGCLPITSNKYKRKYLPCPTCNKVFSQKYSLHRHMTKHGDIVKIPCELCNKMLIDKSSLNRHIRNMHTSKEEAIKKKVQCGLCKRKVKDIESHMAVHTVRPMKCETCGKNYPDAAVLHRHVRNVHHDVNKIFHCTECDRRPYSRRESLRSHMLKKHGCDLKAE